MNLLLAVLFLPLAAFVVALLLPRNTAVNRMWALLSSIGIFVAALGRATGPQEERGVYRTTDGGATWQTVEGNITTNDDPYLANEGNGITGTGMAGMLRTFVQHFQYVGRKALLQPLLQGQRRRHGAHCEAPSSGASWPLR